MPDNARESDINAACQQLDISDDDILAAMKQISGYLDITPGDFKEVYVAAYRQAVARLANRVTAADVMTRDVAAVDAGTPLEEVVDLMAQRRIAGLPVLDRHRRVVGVIAERDILILLGNGQRCTFMEVVARCLKHKGCAAGPLAKKAAADVMSRPAITVTADWTAPRVSELFFEKKINRVPVVDQQGKLVGIVTRQDLVQTACML